MTKLKSHDALLLLCTEKDALHTENLKINGLIIVPDVENEYSCLVIHQKKDRVMRRLMFTIAMLGLLTACTDKKEQIGVRGETIDLLREVCTTQQVDHTLQVIDSLEQAGDMQPPVSDYWRGVVYDMGWRYRLAAYYYQRAFDTYLEPITDWPGYAETGYRLACMKWNMQDYDKGLQIATRLVAQADSLEKKGTKAFPRTYHAFLFSLISDFQIHLQQYDEAKRNCQRAFDILTGGKGSDVVDRLTMCAGNVNVFLEIDDIDAAETWLERAETEYNELEQQLSSGRNIAPIVSEYRQRLSLLRACILQAQGKTDEAASAYVSVPDGDIMRLPANLEASVRYLMTAGRYDEALTYMNRIDTLSPASERPRMTFDIIRDRMVPRYKALLKAGHNAEAIATATDICQAIDSAMAVQKLSDAAELSVIYETQQKDLALERKENSEHIHLIIISGLVLLLIISAIVMCNIIITKRRLHEKNIELFETIQLMADKEEKAQEKILSITAMEPQTPIQKLYLQLIELMCSKQPYTDSELTRENLAQMLGTNSRYLADAIRECAGGISLGEYLDNWRIRHAARMLTETDEPIGLVINMSGLSSRSHFNAIFREHYKMTPTEYRRIAKENSQK